MKVTFGVHALAAVVVCCIGFGTVTLAAFSILTIGFAWLGIAVLMIGSVIWVHGQINRIVERMTCREDAAFNLGKIAAVRQIR